MIDLRSGDCLKIMKKMKRAGEQFDSCVTDAPYHLGSIVARFGGEGAAPAKRGKTGAYVRASRGFMEQSWDKGDIAFRRSTWRLVYDLLKPGAMLAAFSGTRSYHRMATAIEDAGFVVLDMVQWQYGSGFPKNYNVAKAIDKAVGAIGPYPEPWRPISDLALEYFSMGTALKPAQEPICIAMKPREGSILENLALHGTGVFNIDACRVEMEEQLRVGACKLWSHSRMQASGFFGTVKPGTEGHDLGRWPANVIHDGSEEVTRLYPTEAGQRGIVRGDEPSMVTAGIFGTFAARVVGPSHDLDRGSAARFFYSGKAKPGERVTRCESCETRYMGTREQCCGRELQTHPTVKPVDPMRWLVRLITPPRGRVLDPFAGTGTTGIAAQREGMRCTLIEADPLFVGDIEFRLGRLAGDDTPLLSMGK